MLSRSGCSSQQGGSASCCPATLPSALIFQYFPPEMFIVGSQPHLQRVLLGRFSSASLLRWPHLDLVQGSTSMPSPVAVTGVGVPAPSQGPAFTLPLKNSPTHPLPFLPSGFSCPRCPLQSRACSSQFLDPFISLIWIWGPRTKD